MLSQGPQEKANKDVIASILSYFQFQRGKNVSAIEKITPVFPVSFIFQAVCLPPVIEKLALLKCLAISFHGREYINKCPSFMVGRSVGA
jgi:hypothetical protein